MVYFQQCCICARGLDLDCSLDCLYAPFFPAHMTTVTDEVTAYFNLLYVLATLNIIQDNNHPQPFTSILFMKLLFKETRMRRLDPIVGPYQSMRVRARSLADRVMQQGATIRRLKRELNVARAKLAQNQVVLVDEENENLGPPPPPPPPPPL